ncbi:MAG: secretin N-terminal domain-containing protein, partial [Elusimicrobiota bacterium]
HGTQGDSNYSLPRNSTGTAQGGEQRDRGARMREMRQMVESAAKTDLTGSLAVNNDAKSKTILHLNYVKAKDMAVMLQIMIPDITVYAHEELNALEIYDNQQNISEAKKLVEISDLPKRQVVIELQILEISRTRSLDIGVEITNWSINLQSILPPNTVNSNSIGNILFGNITAKGLKTDIKILATPKIMISNRQLAQIHIGDRIPYEVASGGTGGSILYTVQFVDVGIKLTVTPTIYVNDEVDLDINAEVSTVGKLTQRGYPEIGTRKAVTNIHLKDKYTAVLGGLMKEELRKTLVGIPLLIDIPWFGHLFGRTQYEKVITEVRILLTPKIVTEENATVEFPPSKLEPYKLK